MTVQHNGLNTAQHRRRGSLNISLAGGSPAQRATLRESLAAQTEPRMQVGEVSAPGQAPPQSDAARILMIILDDDPDLREEDLRPWIGSGGWSQVTVVTAKRTPEAVRSALRAGADEVLFMPLDPLDLACALLKISEAIPAPASRRARRLTLWSAYRAASASAA
jgi:DNA-binding NarL/FixJ family response regulator